MRFKIKRGYEKPSRADGVRILVDGLWPRGVSKAEAKIDEWLKEIAPSTDLRKWSGHDPARWPEFKRRYFGELQANAEVLEKLRALAKDTVVTFVFSAKDTEHNQAVALREYLESLG
jgi:uncharacterized protein YeaO (DUF488 family)